MPRRSLLARALWLLLGIVCLLLWSVLGPLPIAPGTPFLILAVASFARVSDRFDAWLKRQRWYPHRRKA